MLRNNKTIKNLEIFVTDGRTDGRTDGPTDIAGYRVALHATKKIKEYSVKEMKARREKE